jgi:hypothetical protein
MITVKTLTAAQYNVLNKIARRTKMDCWFLIEQDSNGQDYVHDLESNVNLSLNEGVYCLMEGLDCPENVESCDLNWIEKTVLCELCKMLNIQIPKSLGG